ncbi:MAG: response regulator, partial [Rickettsiales bacterium]|nr:response regulator [Rickettsiales bacterium]
MHRPNPFNLTYTNIKHTRVLIVDDDQTDRMILRRCSELAGFQQVEEAHDGAEAMQKISQFKPDLIYLDMQLPKMNGLEICQEIFNARLQNDIVVIMQTASDHFQSRIEAFKLGVTDYIMKPINAQEVVSRTMAHIERKAYKQQLKQENNR